MTVESKASKVIKPFPLKHVCLYAKVHYVRSGDIWNDLAKCLEGDNYSVIYDDMFSKVDIRNLIIHKIHEHIFNELNSHWRYEEILQHASPEECWKIGFYTKEHKWAANWATNPDPDYDFWEAFMRSYLSEIRNMSLVDLGWDSWCEPDEKVLPIKWKVDKENIMKKIEILEGEIEDELDLIKTQQAELQELKESLKAEYYNR